MQCKVHIQSNQARGLESDFASFSIRNPALNIPRRHEPVATDTVFFDTLAVDSGVKQAQVYVGRDTLVADAYPMKSGK